MPSIVSAKAFANNEVGYLAWWADGKIPGCLGFEVTRVYVDAAGAAVLRPDGSPDRRKTVAYVPFEGQNNPDWNPQDTGVWPVQKYTWRDLTLRKKRDGATRRPAEVRVRYEIRPVGDRKPGLEPVPSNGLEMVTNHTTGVVKKSYEGTPRLLSYLAPATATEPIFITTHRGPFRSTFTNGILAAQWLSNVLMEDGAVQPGELLAKLSDPDDPHRKYLAGDVLPLLHELFALDGEFYLALYELEDTELVDLLVANADRIHVILANTGKSESGLWDVRNHPAREALRLATVDLQDRMFNNSTQIGHNKFVVNVAPNGTPRCVFTGSTNWTATGVAGQTNNALLIENESVAEAYLQYWNRLHADILPLPNPLSAAMGANQQGAALRTSGKTPVRVPLAGGAQISLWFSPNMPQRRKPTNPPIPPDLEEVYRLMRHAQRAIFFLAFYPGQRGKDCIIGEAVDIGRLDHDLLVMGALSSPQAMPNYVPPDHDDADDDDDEGAAGSPSIFFEDNVRLVRAARIDDQGVVGDFGKEVLSAGRAIIHDKVLVIDPLSDHCSVVLGSHNLGYKASYSNDENLIIVEGDRSLAEAYMVHVLDVWDHYRFRAVEAENERLGRPKWTGFLQTTPGWQDPHFDHEIDRLAHYLTGV